MNVTVGRGCIARALAPVRVIEVKAIDHRHVDFPPFHRRVAIVDDLHVLDLVRAVPYDLRARGAIDRWLPAGAVRVGGAEKEDARREREKERREKRERRERREREERERGERQRRETERERKREEGSRCLCIRIRAKPCRHVHSHKFKHPRAHTQATEPCVPGG